MSDNCARCRHRAHDGVCGWAITETIRDDVGIFAPPTYLKRTILVDTCQCGLDTTACSHCGNCGEVHASLWTEGVTYPLCHPNEGMDCYRLVTVYHEPIGARKPGAELDGQPTPIPDNRLPF